MNILILNAGSSSLKCELFDTSGAIVNQSSLWKAQADWKELPGPASLRIESRKQSETRTEVQVHSLEQTVEHLLAGLVEGAHRVLDRFDEIAVTGHRVVHGGDRFRETTRLTSQVRNGIRELAPFAPLHNPLALSAIEAAEHVLGPNSEQIAVFDTSFHSTLPPESYIYPGPRAWLDKGLRRYGFHGISHQYVSQRASTLLGNVVDPKQLRLITCHLGNGCSLCAIKGGLSVETTMGFTPIEGLMMGSRSGTLDPGLLIYLLRHDGVTVDRLDNILNHESGLKGLSGVSSDMRQVSAAAESGDKNARQALDVYVYRLAYFISALLPALGGLDALVFAGGIGENSKLIREQTCRRLGFLGIALDPELNMQPASDRIISTAESAVKVAVVCTQENLQIARECLALTASPQP
jgi:acetate kinase